ncbi:MAG: dipeptidase [Oscillospiraceae bacterium]|nr:dipeptidase [Oscillospiraceae bacterium]
MKRFSAGEIPYFDGHCDTISRCANRGVGLRSNDGMLDLNRLTGFKKAAQVFAIFADWDKFPPGTLFDECCRQREVFVSELEKNRDIAMPCRSGAEIQAANDEGKVAALLSIEGGELLGCDPGRLDIAAQWGVKLVNITWNHANYLSGSHRDEAARGLGPLGKEFVRRANELGILLDVSHLSDQGFWDLERLGSQPLIASHSNARAVCPHSRNLTDDMFIVIRDSGGVAGLNFWLDFVGGAYSMDDILRHVEHFMELDGAKTLALGADWDGCDAAAGNMRGAQDIHLLWNALAARGYEESVLEDLFYNNWLRVMG